MKTNNQSFFEWIIEMLYLPVIAFILFFGIMSLHSCEKDDEQKPKDESCKTCTEKIVSTCFSEPSVTTNIVTQYCNYEWQSHQGKTWTTTNPVNGNPNCSQTHSVTCQ